ncbi:MAG: CDP-archaeol synthase [Saprospiraceae bacterium]|nr:CDP-archaeol synthase [Saprospiraceae bacterium]MCB9324376.1 CDP-archaeol synthase [Lewinellaceae bacterium]
MLTYAKLHIFLLFLPMITGNVLHMIIVRKNLLPGLAIPVSQPLFGRNKTLRGFLVLPILSGVLALLSSLAFGPLLQSHLEDFLTGAGMGVVYLLSELPNSYIKRKLGIANGEHSQRYKLVQIFFDKADSLIGILLFYWLVTPVPWTTIFGLFFISFGIHLSISYLLVRLKIKQSL